MSETKPQQLHAVPKSDGSALEVGSKVLVRNRFLGTWTGGFEVAEVLRDGYRLQRFSDNLVFPDVFPFDEIRREQRHGVRGSQLDRREPGRWFAAPDDLDSNQWLLVPTETEDDE